MGFEFRRLLVRLQSTISIVNARPVQDLVDLVRRVAGVQNPDFVNQDAFFYPAVRTLDESILVNPRKARERRDKTDVRTFRRLDGADSSIVRGVDVANFEARAFTG